MKITFNKVDDFTWIAEAGCHTAEIFHTYFGLDNWYDVYIDDVKKSSQKKLADARIWAKQELKNRVNA